MKPIFRIVNLVKTYQTGQTTTKAVDQISFEILAGEFVVIIGDSGCGKSTTLNLIGGMDNASSGQIFFKDSDITGFSNKELSEYRKEHIGFVFQNYNLINNLTALENVLVVKDLKKDTLPADSMLELVGLADKKKNFPAELSGGEAQRVAIARAVAKNPSVLLCDEPTGALDYENSRNVIAVIQNLNIEKQMTVIMVTHNQAFTKLANKVIKMKSGKIESITYHDHPMKAKDLEW